MGKKKSEETKDSNTQSFNSEETKRILRKRAEALSKEIISAEDRREIIEITEFKVADERYGIENIYIREVHRLKTYTKLPGVPPHILGVINVRGKILSVLNLAAVFGLRETGIGDLSKVIIIQNDTMEFAILADHIAGVRRYPLKSLTSSLPTLTGVRSDFLKGVTDECLVVLDGEKLLSDKKMIVHQV